MTYSVNNATSDNVGVVEQGLDGVVDYTEYAGAYKRVHVLGMSGVCCCIADGSSIEMQCLYVFYSAAGVLAFLRICYEVFIPAGNSIV